MVTTGAALQSIFQKLWLFKGCPTRGAFYLSPPAVKGTAKIRVSVFGLKLPQAHGREFFALRPLTAAH